MAKHNISIIAAVDNNNGIGKDNKLLCHLPEDLKRFKRITSGHTVIMGRNTCLSLPGGALPDRINIVITDIANEQFPDCLMASSIENALTISDEYDECFVIGGGMIYRQFLPHASKLYITHIHSNFDADTFFPEINYDEWEEISRENFQNQGEAKISFSFVIYKRK